MFCIDERKNNNDDYAVQMYTENTWVNRAGMIKVDRWIRDVFSRKLEHLNRDTASDSSVSTKSAIETKITTELTFLMIPINVSSNCRKKNNQ
jgi:hypothetical protein